MFKVIYLCMPTTHACSSSVHVSNRQDAHNSRYNTHDWCVSLPPSIDSSHNHGAVLPFYSKTHRYIQTIPHRQRFLYPATAFFLRYTSTISCREISTLPHTLTIESLSSVSSNSTGCIHANRTKIINKLPITINQIQLASPNGGCTTSENSQEKTPINTSVTITVTHHKGSYSVVL